MDKVIIVDHLVKSFNYGTILKDISFTIQTGELVGLLTTESEDRKTLLKIISGLLKPTSGFVSVLGFDPAERTYDFLKQISLIDGQEDELWMNLPAIESIKLNKAIYNIADSEYNKNLDELVYFLDASKLLKTKVKDLTIEERIKINLIASLIHKPKVLFIDESVVNIEFLHKYNKKNETTILLTSNKVKNLIGFVRRVILIDKCKLLFDGPLENLIKKI